MRIIISSYVFCILVEMGFHHVAQAGLKLLSSDIPPTKASQSARIIGMCHHAQLIFCIFSRYGETLSLLKTQKNYPGVVADACNPSYSEAWDRESLEPVRQSLQ